MDIIEEIKSRLPIEEVVGKYVTLKPGGKYLKGVCPFHDDHDPSFTVNPAQNFCWCFVCQSGGDIFGFIRKIENVEFPEAVQILGEMAGVEVEKTTFNAQVSQEKREEKSQLRTLLEESNQFFQTFLTHSEEAKTYILKRNISEEIQKIFRVGYAPKDFHMLETFLLKKGFSRKEMLAAGVVTTKDIEKGEVYDKFRNRIIFPIYDGNGKICGFSGRVIDPKEEPKYLNSPESPLYHKSKILYGLHLAKKSIQNEKRAILVEGNMDVITCHQFGITNAVASSGTAFTLDQARMIKRLTNTVLLAFDTDNAGKLATKKAAEICIPLGMEVFVLNLTHAKDLDEGLHANLEQTKQALQNATPFFEALLPSLAEGYDTSSLAGKKALLQEYFGFLKLLETSMEQQELLKSASSFLSIEHAALEQDYSNFLKRNTKRKPPQKTQDIKRELSQSDFFWGMLLAYPEYFSYTKEKISAKLFEENQLQEFFTLLMKESEKENISFKGISEKCHEELQENLQKALLYTESRNQIFPPEEIQKIYRNTVDTFKAEQKKKRVLQITEQMKKYASDTKEYGEMIQKLMEVQKL